MVSRVYPAYHPKAGQPTGFRESILSGRKIHTLRNSAGNRNNGDVVSLRELEWEPYISKQIEFARCEIGIVPVSINSSFSDSQIADIAARDGFDDPKDFQHWFTDGRDEPINFQGVCIWFAHVKQQGGKSCQLKSI
jgi:hypothetical protein